MVVSLVSFVDDKKLHVCCQVCSTILASTLSNDVSQQWKLEAGFLISCLVCSFVMKSYYCTIIVESTSFVMLFNRNY